MASWTPTNWAPGPDFPANSLSKFHSLLGFSWGLNFYNQTMKRLTVSVCLWDLRARRGVYNRNIPRIGMGTPSPHSDPQTKTKTPSHSLQRLWGPRKLGPGKEGAQFAWNLSQVLTIGIFPFCSWFVCQYLRKHWIDKEAVNLSLSNNTKLVWSKYRKLELHSCIWNKSTIILFNQFIGSSLFLANVKRDN